MKKKFLLALSAILLIGMAAGIYQHAKKNSAHRNRPKETRTSTTPSPTAPFDLEDEESPVTDVSRPKTMEVLHYQNATKISSFVQDKQFFTSDHKLLKDMKGIISRLSPNKMPHPPLPKDDKERLEGAWTSLDIHDEQGLLYNFLLTNLGGGYVVYVGGEKYSFYCDIAEEDITRFQNIYRKIYNKYASAPKDE